jgi:pimeloyl-ACP methyl ester carboxylesterase
MGTGHFGPASRAARVARISLLLAVTLGCSTGITVRRANGPDLFDAWRASVVDPDEVSARTLQTLHQWDLDGVYRRHPAEALARLQARVAEDPEPDLLFSLSEICYLLGRRAEIEECGRACVFHYLCAGYAYHFLFDREPAAENTFDPRFRLACDLYNTSLAKCIRAAQRSGRLDPRQQLHLAEAGFTLSVVHHGFLWPPEEFGPLLFCADYQPVGLSNWYRGYGLGVSLIGTRVHDRRIETGPAHSFFPRDVSFPVTAFFRFEGAVADLLTQRSGRLELYNPLEIQAAHVNGRPVPLETDLTTPLAFFLSRSDLEEIAFAGFLRADKVERRAGIYMLEPYQPGKIPVVMVHGLLSSPLTWATLFNDLRADPELRKHFQFWFYLYPTGSPYLATAADLRQALAGMRAQLDPACADPALDDLVLVGHSMGGLVSRLLTVEGGDDFWRLASDRPLSGLNVRAETRDELNTLFYFRRQPGVRRVVFLGTPHHGSALSPRFVTRLVSRAVHLPADLMRAARDVAGSEAGFWHGRIPTSVDLLAPDSPALELLAARPRPDGVHYHSIIGDITGKGPGGTDGVVPVASAHLESAESEVLVPADHTTVHRHPRAVLEVRRILWEHLREAARPPASAAAGTAPAGGEAPNRRTYAATQMPPLMSGGMPSMPLSAGGFVPVAVPLTAR